MRYKTIESFLILMESHMQESRKHELFLMNQNPVKIAMILIDVLRRIEGSYKIASFRTD